MSDARQSYVEGLVHSLELRVDGVEAAIGELRAKVQLLEGSIRELALIELAAAKKTYYACTCGWRVLHVGESMVSIPCGKCGGVAVAGPAP